MVDPTPTDAASEPKVSCVFADDNPVMRDGIRIQLEDIPWIQIVGEASNGTEALDAIRHLLPQIAVLDHRMPGITGMQIAQQVEAEGLPTRVVLYSSMTDIKMIRQAFKGGLAGYILKVASEVELALRLVHEGGTYIDPAIAKSLVCCGAECPNLQETT